MNKEFFENMREQTEPDDKLVRALRAKIAAEKPRYEPAIVKWIPMIAGAFMVLAVSLLFVPFVNWGGDIVLPPNGNTPEPPTPPYVDPNLPPEIVEDLYFEAHEPDARNIYQPAIILHSDGTFSFMNNGIKTMSLFTGTYTWSGGGYNLTAVKEEIGFERTFSLNISEDMLIYSGADWGLTQNGAIFYARGGLPAAFQAAENPPPDETVAIKIWSYAETHSTDYGDERNFSYEIVYVPEENFLEEAAKAMLEHGGFSVNSMEYVGDMLFVDLHLSEWQKHDAGTMAGVVRTNTLKRTLASFPEVKKFAVSIDGIKDPEDNHFNYSGFFVVSGPQLKEICTFYVNAKGQTYGSAAYADPNELPDLIAVLATNGKEGYILREDFIGPMPQSPEEAVKLMEEYKKLNEQGIYFITKPVYLSDGETVIGEFEQSIKVGNSDIAPPKPKPPALYNFTIHENDFDFDVEIFSVSSGIPFGSEREKDETNMTITFRFSKPLVSEIPYLDLVPWYGEGGPQLCGTMFNFPTHIEDWGDWIYYEFYFRLNCCMLGEETYMEGNLCRSHDPSYPTKSLGEEFTFTIIEHNGNGVLAENGPRFVATFTVQDYR